MQPPTRTVISSQCLLTIFTLSHASRLPLVVLGLPTGPSSFIVRGLLRSLISSFPLFSRPPARCLLHKARNGVSVLVNVIMTSVATTPRPTRRICPYLEFTKASSRPFARLDIASRVVAVGEGGVLSPVLEMVRKVVWILDSIPPSCTKTMEDVYLL